MSKLQRRILNNKNSQNSKSKLSSLLDKYDEYLKQRKEQKDREQSERAKNTESFIKIRDEIIRPVFEKIKAEIEARGHTVQIEVKEPSWNSEKNIPIDPSIKFKLKLITERKNQNHYHGKQEIPYLSFIYNSLERKIYRHKSTIGTGQLGYAGSKKKFKLYRITRKVVEEELITWLDNLMSDVAPSYF